MRYSARLLKLFFIHILLVLPMCVWGQTFDQIASSAEYIYGEGNARSAMQADRMALASISEQISVSVRSVFEIQNRKTTEDVISTYSSAKLTNCQKMVLENGPDNFRIVRYIHKDEIERMFKSRELKVLEMVGTAQRAEEERKFDVALKYYSWAKLLLGTLTYPNEVYCEDMDGEKHQVGLFISERINDILDGIGFEFGGYTSDDNTLAVVYVTCKGSPVTSLDYAYWDGVSWSALTQARDGRGTIELRANSNVSSINIKIEHLYEQEMCIDPDFLNIAEYFAPRQNPKSQKNSISIAPPAPPTPAASSQSAVQSNGGVMVEGVSIQQSNIESAIVLADRSQTQSSGTTTAEVANGGAVSAASVTTTGVGVEGSASATPTAPATTTTATPAGTTPAIPDSTVAPAGTTTPVGGGVATEGAAPAGASAQATAPSSAKTVDINAGNVRVEDITISVEEADHVAVIEDIVPYQKTIGSVISAISSRNYKAASQYFTEEGYEFYSKLIAYGRAKVLATSSFNPVEDLEVAKFDGEYICRSIPMLFSFSGNRSFVENVVFVFNEEGKISSVQFGLERITLNEILSKRQWSASAKLVLINFLENYRTAFALSRIDYLDSVFSEDAIIITGKVVKRTNVEGLINLQNKDHIILNRQTKSEYINNLRRSFRSKEYINLQFSNMKITRMDRGNNEIYCMEIKQDYYSSNYADTGYLTLVVDVTDHSLPIIHVRTWLPEPVPEFGTFSAGHF